MTRRPIFTGNDSWTQSDFEGTWEDLRFPAQGINPAGAAAPPGVDAVVTGFPGTLLFSGTLENVIAGVAQMPHGWANGSEIHPHIHWMKPTGSSSAVTWHFYYRHLGFPPDAVGDWQGPVVGTIAAGDQTLSDSHLITTFGSIDMTGKIESSMLCWRVHRMGNTDADNNNVRLLEFDIHYLVEKTGTLTEIPTGD